jgi:transcriptional regulator with XRE-family HTH domain
MTSYETFASDEDGQRRLAKSRLRHSVLTTLHEALASAKLTKTEVASRLGVRKSAVGQVFGGDGNVRINTLADYLFAMGLELDIHAVPVGELRKRVERGGPKVVPIAAARPMASIHEAGRLRPDTVRPWGSGTRVVNG